jgi:uncharacterized protein YbjT (DUF2867 family)
MHSETFSHGALTGSISRSGAIGGTVSESPGWKSVVAAAYDDFDASVRAAAEAGVRHVVYTSFASAAPDAAFTLGRDHFDAEQAIVETGVAHTFLRDSFYLDLLPFFSDATGVIRGPAGDGRVAGVARADVADVAATVLRAPADHAGATYGLTGPEALTFSEMAARASAVLGRDLRFETRPTTRRTPGGARSTAPRTGSSMPG